MLQALGWALFLAIAYVARPSEDSVPELLQLAGVVAMSICGLLGSLALRLSGGAACARPITVALKVVINSATRTIIRCLLPQ
ncbi:hypothetical protein GGR70_001570 [Xanthomonas campestris]|uniref:hypothetical protein n=1 Tax=Xanthomonas campestris TaxID=339 RepID=UPI002169219A|nr:hypothetical protein [Xanthomonas campestris]MCS3846584.1 hypothetical protein [Xanthomonas campestris]